VIVRGVQYRKEQILDFTVYTMRIWGWRYGAELILNITVFVVRGWRKAM